jgi:hypothetical protein
LGLALVRDMRELRAPSSADEVAAFETDVLAGFVLARASAGLADSSIRNDTGHLDLIRDWLGRPLRKMRGWTYIGTGSHVKAVRVGQRGCPGGALSVRSGSAGARS